MKRTRRRPVEDRAKKHIASNNRQELDVFCHVTEDGVTCSKERKTTGRASPGRALQELLRSLNYFEFSTGTYDALNKLFLYLLYNKIYLTVPRI